MKGLRKLSEFVANANIEDFPDRTVLNAKICILDLLGCAIGGSGREKSRALQRVFEDIGGPADSTVISRAYKTSCVNASFLNAFFSHVLEFDDVHVASVTHPGAAIIPSALALAEKSDVSGADFVEGIIVGYEVGVRLGLAAGTDHYSRWHTTATCGAFGSAAASSRILGLDVKRVNNALNIAATQASGIWEFLEGEAASSKGLHPGMAASNGLLSALLAKEDFIGSDSSVEGERGYLASTSSNSDPVKLIDALGDQYKIDEVTLKPYPSCRHTHPSIDAAIALRGRLSRGIRDVEEVLIRTYNVAEKIAGRFQITTVAEVKFSLPFCVALALTRGRVTLQDFTERDLEDESIRSLIPKTSILIDDTYDRAYPENWTSTVRVKTVDGASYSETVNIAKGDPRNPLTVDEVKEKFKTLCLGRYPEESLEQITELILSLDELSRVRELTKLLA